MDFFKNIIWPQISQREASRTWLAEIKASGNLRIASFQRRQYRLCMLLQFANLLESRGEAVENLGVEHYSVSPAVANAKVHKRCRTHSWGWTVSGLDCSGRVSIDCAAEYASWSQNGMDKSEAIEGGYSNT